MTTEAREGLTPEEIALRVTGLDELADRKAWRAKVAEAIRAERKEADALRAEVLRLKLALTDAAKSLEWIATPASDPDDAKRYATCRAEVARAALNPPSAGAPEGK